MASKRRIRRKQCGDKQKYDGESSALAFAIAHLRRTGQYRRIYRCSWCHKWHTERTSAVDKIQRGYA